MNLGRFAPEPPKPYAGAYLFKIQPARYVIINIIT